MISNGEKKDIMELVKYLEKSSLLNKGVSKPKNEAKEKKDGFLDMLLGKLGDILLWNLLAGKGVICAGERAPATSRCNFSRTGFLMPSHPLTSFEIQKFCQNETKFNGVYSRNNLPKINDGAYVINMDEYKSIGSHWIALYANGDNVT